MGVDPEAGDDASVAFAIAALLRGSWRSLSAGDRDRLLVDLLRRTSTVARSHEGEPSTLHGPSVDELERCRAATDFDVVLQPIVWLPTRETVGYEALTRFDRWSPDQWFRRAWAVGVGLEFEVTAVERAIGVLDDLPTHIYLAINVSPHTAVCDALSRLLKGVDCTRLVLELTEHAPIVDYAIYRRKLDRLRDRGVRIAVDDVGAGHSSLQHIVRLAPDIIKLDRGLVAGCDADARRTTLIRHLARFAHETRACMVAEGVETGAEASQLVACGIAFGQGYHFGHPQPRVGRTRRDPMLAL